MKAILRKSNALVGLKKDLQWLRQNYLSGQKSAIDSYLREAEAPALHIGAGGGHLPGWLETDIEPVDAQTTYLDATQPIPAPTAAFAYVYSEHMIEHVPFAAGLAMLKECRRVLRPGGVLRVATPDLAFILNLYSNPGDDGRRYMRWITGKFPPGMPANENGASSIINNAMRAWGHQFLYDAATLESSLREAGFTSITRVRYNQSAHENLRGIEKHGANVGSVEMAMLETMIYEASC